MDIDLNIDNFKEHRLSLGVIPYGIMKNHIVSNRLDDSTDDNGLKETRTFLLNSSINTDPYNSGANVPTNVKNKCNFEYGYQLIEYTLNQFINWSNMNRAINEYITNDRRFNCVIKVSDSGGDICGYKDISFMIISFMFPVIQLCFGFSLIEKYSHDTISLSPEVANDIRKRWQLKSGGLTHNGIDHSVSAITSILAQNEIIVVKNSNPGVTTETRLNPCFHSVRRCRQYH